MLAEEYFLCACYYQTSTIISIMAKFPTTFILHHFHWRNICKVHVYSQTKNADTNSQSLNKFIFYNNASLHTFSLLLILISAHSEGEECLGFHSVDVDLLLVQFILLPPTSLIHHPILLLLLGLLLIPALFLLLAPFKICVKLGLIKVDGCLFV